MQTVNVSGLKNNPSEALRSARIAQMPLAAFIAHVSRLGIAVVEMDETEVTRDIETLDQWLALS